MNQNASDFADRYFQSLEFEKAKSRKETKEDLVQELLADLEEKEHEVKASPIEQYYDDRLRTTRRLLEQTRAEMETRFRMNRRFMDEIDSQIRYAQFSLEKFSGWGVGYNTGVDVKRNHLERQLQQLRAERRAAELRAWDDIVRLRKNFQDGLSSYKGALRLASE